ncbi:terpene synthase family protein [Streptomyces zhihengii]|uniref:Terpene synthase n=1 Tax=Streptomyces zhihengii TaxID=1818004 RepID=A0ABS2V3Q1_9ACTN|nr:hypothetical protein [Streptomyces zhihengii]MBM9624461.1 hypothetical protein [Streptomyces zhihengii]
MFDLAFGDQVHLDVPDLNIPFTATLHPAVAAAGDHAITWAREAGLLEGKSAEERALREGHFRFASWMYPTASLSHLVQLTAVDAWMFLADDHADELRTIDGLISSGGILGEVLQRIEADMSPQWCTRFREHLADWVTSNEQAATRHHAQEVPSLEEYVPWRRVSGTLLWGFDLVEYATERELPAASVSSSAYAELVEAAADVICWTNDLYSAPKEIQRGDPNNLLVVLQHHYGMTLQEAAEATVERIEARVSEFHALLPTMLDQAPPSSLHSVHRAWADGLASWMRGNLEFCRESPRYAMPAPSSE